MNHESISSIVAHQGWMLKWFFEKLDFQEMQSKKHENPSCQ